MPESTAELYTVAQQALASSGIYALRELTVEPHDNGLLISGAVSSFYLKQLAQEVVRAVAGAVEVVNSVRVSEENEDQSAL
jgi:osmotically-inducible protein OsmY